MLIPDRNSFVVAGQEFCNNLPSKKLDPVREKALLDEFLTGAHVPDFYRNFVTLEVGDDKHAVTISVAPDYLCVGTDDDYVRIPLNPISAQRIADAWDCTLPTKKMVDLIWKAAPIKLSPFPLPPTAAMTTVEWFLRSNDAIQKQLGKEPTFSLGMLVGGHKKDVVVTSKTFVNAKRVAIYGWHQKNGKAIQGPGVNGSSHEETYADYSHGIRLIDNVAYVDGIATTIQEILKDSDLCRYLSEEGVVDSPRYKV
jgi:hypothetical protein